MGTKSLKAVKSTDCPAERLCLSTEHPSLYVFAELLASYHPLL